MFRQRLAAAAISLAFVGAFLFVLLCLSAICYGLGGALAQAQWPQVTLPSYLPDSPQRQRACGLRNGLSRELTEQERWDFLQFTNQTMWRSEVGCGRSAAIDTVDPLPPPIVFEFYGQPELTITGEDGRLQFACWCLRREYLATLSADHPLRQARPAGSAIPTRRFN